MSKYANIIKAALESAGTGAKKVGKGAVDIVKKYPKTASFMGGSAATGAFIENTLQQTMEDLREQGFSDEQIIDYLLSYDVNNLQEGEQ